MFLLRDNFITSSVLDTPCVKHVFSTRLGGVSTNPNTRTMNVAPSHGDTERTVYENISILAKRVGGDAESTVCTHQIHSSKLVYADEKMRGHGVCRPNEVECDGFYTDIPGIVLMVRTADCAPLILCGQTDEKTAVCAVHAGWRGTASAIAENAVNVLVSLGIRREDIRAAIGPCAHFELFEVGEDMRDRVSELRGRDFAHRHVREREGKLYADVPGMNRELLLNSGVPEGSIDVCDLCTMANPELFHSHRITKGNRGAMGNAVCICR